MSHFSVAVFTEPNGKTVEELLAPFQENNMGDCPREYLEFHNKEEEERENYETGTVDMRRTPDGKLHFSWKVDTMPYEEIEVKFKDLYTTFDEYITDFCGYKKDEETGLYGYWENPNKKWDWYSIGGRWIGKIIMKPGKKGFKGTPGLCTSEAAEDKYDSALVSDIDFEAMEAHQKKELCPMSKCFERSFYKPEYFNRMYPNEETYIKRKTSFSTYAVVTPDGVWRSAGDMGWFGFSSESPEEKQDFEDMYKEQFIVPAIKNGWYMTIVDCHI